MLDLKAYINSYIDNNLEDEYTPEKDKEYLESLTDEDKEKILYKLEDDEDIDKVIMECLDYYVWHTEKRKID